jgi:hypothetical protein
LVAAAAFDLERGFDLGFLGGAVDGGSSHQTSTLSS